MVLPMIASVHIAVFVTPLPLIGSLRNATEQVRMSLNIAANFLRWIPGADGDKTTTRDNAIFSGKSWSEYKSDTYPKEETLSGQF